MQMTLGTARTWPAGQAGDGRSALVVEADHGHALDTALVLESEGYAAHVAIGPEDAVSLCRGLSPMLALIDVAMATASRGELMTRLAGLRPEMILVLAADESQVGRAVAALAEGAYAYLRKPFDSAELRALLARCDEVYRLRLAQARSHHAEREHHRHLHGLTDRLPVAVFELDAGGRFRFVNATFARWLAEPVGPIVGRTAEEILGAAYPTLRPCLEGALDGRAETLEAAVPIAGEERVVRVACSPRRDSSRKVVGVFGQVEDTTVLRRVEESVRTRDAWLRAILANSPTEIALKDRDGRVLAVSRNTLEDHGLTEEEVIGRKSEELLPPELIEAYVAADRHVVTTGEVLQQEITEMRDGRLEHYLSAKFPLTDDAGAIIGVCSLTSHITPFKQVQARLHEAQKMEAVGQLTGGVAHEFNNLLAVMLGNLELAEDQLDGGHACRELVQRALAAGRRGATLNHRLLAFSRQQMLQPSSLDINETVAGMAGLLGCTLGELIDLRVDAEVGLWRCSADAAQLESALLNLAVNARDAMPQGGRLTLKTANVTLGGTGPPSMDDVEAGDFAMLAVGDSGVGIAPEVIGRVFDPFFTTKGPGKHSGLGLSMVFGFAKQSGGHVTIESGPEAGTTVKLYLPRCLETLEAPAPPGTRPVQGRRSGATEPPATRPESP